MQGKMRVTGERGDRWRAVLAVLAPGKPQFTHRRVHTPRPGCRSVACIYVSQVEVGSDS